MTVCVVCAAQLLREQQATLAAANAEVLARQQDALRLQRERQTQQLQWQQRQAMQGHGAGPSLPVPPSPGRGGVSHRPTGMSTAVDGEDMALSWSTGQQAGAMTASMTGTARSGGSARTRTPTASHAADTSGSEEEDVPWVPGPATRHSGAGGHRPGNRAHASGTKDAQAPAQAFARVRRRALDGPVRFVRFGFVNRSQAHWRWSRWRRELSCHRSATWLLSGSGLQHGCARGCPGRPLDLVVEARAKIESFKVKTCALLKLNGSPLYEYASVAVFL